jgi:hypothetical protein
VGIGAGFTSIAGTTGSAIVMLGAVRRTISGGDGIALGGAAGRMSRTVRASGSRSIITVRIRHIAATSIACATNTHASTRSRERRLTP